MSRSPCSGRSKSPGLKGKRFVNWTRPARTPGGADDQQPLVVEEHLDVVEDDAVVADLDDAALHLHLAAEIAQAKVDGVEVEAPADVGVEQGPPQVGPDVRLALRVGDGVRRRVGQQARADVAVDVGLEVLGDEPGAERGASAQLHRRAVDGDGQVLDRHAAAAREREPPGVDDDVAVEPVRADVDRVDDRHLAAQIRACRASRRRVSSARRSPPSRSTATAPRNGCRSSRSRCPESAPEMARPSSRPSTRRSPPSVAKCASSSTMWSPATWTCTGRAASIADPLHRRLAVGTVDGARDRQPELGQQDVERQRLPGLEIDGDPPAGDAAPVAERRPARAPARASSRRRNATRP